MNRVSEILRVTLERMEIPVWCFQPDNWSLAFLRGLSRLAFPGWEGKKIWEVGVGSGINIAMLSQLIHATWYFSDYDSRCVPLAESNLSHTSARGTFNPLSGSWDLLTPFNGSIRPVVDVIFGCIPQVPAKMDLSVGDRLAHYYDPGKYPFAHLHELGLGLVETLLVQAEHVLPVGGEIVLNLGGRPGLPKILSLFVEKGYSPRVVHSETIEQHAGTSLSSLVELEAKGYNFEFFCDPECLNPVSARASEILRQAGKKVFHRIYVVAGRKL